VFEHVAAAPLPDVQRREGGHLVAERDRIDRRGEAGDHPPFGEPVQAGLHRPARDAQPTGQF
jgi:hypothetical protein